MPRLVIANTTKQFSEFHYRIPGGSRAYSITIPPGMQRALPHKDLSNEDIRYILDKAEGTLIDERQIANMKMFVGLAYAIDRDINVNRIEAAIERNDAILDARSEQMHRDTLVAASHAMQQHTGGRGKVQTLELEEKTSQPKKERKVRKTAMPGSREAGQ